MTANSKRTSRRAALLMPAFFVLFTAAQAQAQVFSFSREQMIEFTSQNPYERFPDGRPKVPDELLERMKSVVAPEVYGILRGKGFTNQFEGNWQMLQPGKKLIGRAFTVQFMPARPDMAEAAQARAKAAGFRRLGNQAAIDQLQPGDVIVVDLFGKIGAGTFAGDKLAYYIMKTTGTGMVVDGALFHLDTMANFGMPAYYRGADAASLGNVVLSGINVPVRIGNVTVMPGDVVLGDRHGVTFIPPQLVKDVVESAERAHVRDEWIFKKFDEKKYKSGEIYGRPSDPALAKELEDYIQSHTKK